MVNPNKENATLVLYSLLALFQYLKDLVSHYSNLGDKVK